MNVDLIKMNRDQALTQFRVYRDAVRERHSDEYSAIMHGYKALSKGYALLDLGEVMKRAGLDAYQRPRLAIARATGQHVYCRVAIDGRAQFCIRHDWYRSSRHCCISFPKGTFSPQNSTHEKWERTWHQEAKAILPLIPAALRPKASLENYHILWEAEWESVPRDPLLLRHLSGMLYAVMANWDLTSLERAVLRGRLLN